MTDNNSEKLPEELVRIQEMLGEGWLKVDNQRLSVVLSDGMDLRADDGGLGGGLLHKTLHKSLHKGLHKSLHKSLHKGLHKSVVAAGSGMAAGSGFDWPVIEVPWREITRLYDLRHKYAWHQLDFDELPPPPPVDQRIKETERLLELQDELRLADNTWRRERIVIEASNDLTAYMLPLGADVTSPSSRTAIMFQTILWLGSLIGLLYKERFNSPRPHVINPQLEPYIPVPAYSAYPSNHAFQSFLIADVFARAVPEHPGNPHLYKAARDVAENREWAGLHVESDTQAGEALARICAPMFEEVLKDHLRSVRAEWLGEEVLR